MSNMFHKQGKYIFHSDDINATVLDYDKQEIIVLTTIDFVRKGLITIEQATPIIDLFIDHAAWSAESYIITCLTPI